MDNKLDLILQKLETLDEVKEIVLALREGQEVSNAKLEALSMDVHKLHGEVENIKSDIQFNAYKITETEREIFRLKKQ